MFYSCQFLQNIHFRGRNWYSKEMKQAATQQKEKNNPYANAE